EADFLKEFQAGGDFVEDGGGDGEMERRRDGEKRIRRLSLCLSIALSLRLTQLSKQSSKKGSGVGDAETANISDVLGGETDSEGFGAEASAAAGGAGDVAAK